jgi:hypothetical protein
VFEFAEAAFDAVALFIEFPIIFARLFAVAPGWDDGLCSVGFNMGDDGVGVVTLTHAI